MNYAIVSYLSILNFANYQFEEKLYWPAMLTKDIKFNRTAKPNLNPQMEPVIELSVLLKETFQPPELAKKHVGVFYNF